MLRKIRRPALFLFFVIALTIFCVSLFGKRFRIGVAPPVGGKAVAKEESSDLFFLKAHKCGSSTIQNVLMRYGYLRGLNFVLPPKANYLGNPEPFRPYMIDPRLRTADDKYNMFTHHTRYNHTSVRSIMTAGTKFVTVLRDPADLYESLFSYYHLERLFNSSLGRFLDRPDKIGRLQGKRVLGRIGVNQMSWDLGLEQRHFRDDGKIRQFVERIEREFDLVMISEYMPASLVLLADLMNWPLENVAFVSLNSRLASSRVALTEAQREKLRYLNSADARLYDHFLGVFRRRVNEYGAGRMLRDVERLLGLNRHLMARCSYKTKSGYAKTVAYRVENNADWICDYAAKQELEFTEEIRSEQIDRLGHLNRIRRFIHKNSTHNKKNIG